MSPPVSPPPVPNRPPQVARHSLTVWQELKEAVVPVVMYNLLTLFTFGIFCASAIVTDGFSTGAIGAVAILAVATFGGLWAGQLLALFRVRTWVIMVFGGILWTVMFAMTAAITAALAELGILLILFLLIFPVGMTGGLWSLETNRSLWSTWLPIVFTTGTILMWADEAAWKAGDKMAAWGFLSLAALGGTLTLLLFYLVTRETHRLALWRRGPEAPLQPKLVEKGSGRPRLSFLGVFLVGAFAFALTVGTALIAPYLWRTGEDDQGAVEKEQAGQEPQEKPSKLKKNRGQPQPEPAEPEPGDGDFGQRVQETGEKMVEAAKEAAGAMCPLATLMALLVLGLLVAWRPVRRLLVVRHLRAPFWEVPPTRRIEQGWQLVEIALGDAGLHPRPGEDAAGLARRAGPTLRRLSPVEVHGLTEAADVADRVRFGLGVTESDVAVMERFSGWALDTVWERLGQWDQVKCMYREV